MGDNDRCTKGLKPLGMVSQRPSVSIPKLLEFGTGLDLLSFGIPFEHFKGERALIPAVSQLSDATGNVLSLCRLSLTCAFHMKTL